MLREILFGTIPEQSRDYLVLIQDVFSQKLILTAMISETSISRKYIAWYDNRVQYFRKCITWNGFRVHVFRQYIAWHDSRILVIRKYKLRSRPWNVFLHLVIFKDGISSQIDFHHKHRLEVMC